MQEWQAIVKKHRAILAPFVGRPLAPGSDEHRRFTEVERAYHEEVEAWQRKYSGKGRQEPKTPAELEGWIDEQRMVIEAACRISAEGEKEHSLPEQMRRLCWQAREYARSLRKADPSLPQLPTRTGSAVDDVQAMTEWCTERPDEADFRPASEFLTENRPPRSYRELRRILDENPWIRRFKPSKQRLMIHAGDMLRWQAEQDKQKWRSLNSSQGTADAALAEARQRKAAIDKQREQNAGK